MPRQHQGSIKAAPQTPVVVTLGAPPTPEDDRERLKKRIIGLLRAGVPRLYRAEERGPWLTPPGACAWWEMRQRVGGRTARADFRAAVDDLLAEGRLIEVWLALPGRRTPAHALLLPGASAALRHPVAQARGRSDVLAGEPWAAALGPARDGG